MFKAINSSHVLIAVFLLATTFCINSCKKNDDLPPNNNELRATVILSSGIQLNVMGLGNKVRLGCDPFGISSYVEGSDETNGAVSFSNPGNCVVTPGTFDKVSIRYVRYPNSQSSLVYDNIILRSPGASLTYSGSVTFTVVLNDYWEGTFNAVCWTASQSDSVTVSGTFKGKKSK